MHARNVALVMDRHSARVSPQFHVKYDRRFDTVRQDPLECTWMRTAGFIKVPIQKLGTKEPTALTTAPSKKSIETSLRAEPSTVDTICTLADIDPALHPKACTTILDDYHDTEQKADPVLAMKAQTDPDTMYHHQAMKQPDRAEFEQAMDKEINDQLDNGNFSLIPKSTVPPDATILNAVWQMKRKRDLRTGKILKYKARLNVDGSRMQKGKDYDLTYAPVATWASIRMLLVMVLLHKWKTVQLDYVLAFPQAPINRELYMRLPKGMNPPAGSAKDYVLKLHRNVYGQKQAARVWNKYLVQKLTSPTVGFTQSKYDECVFYKRNIIYILYTDDSIIAGPDQKEIDKTIQLIKSVNLDITIEGDIRDFLGINITRSGEDSYVMTQPQLIRKILQDLSLTKPDVKSKTVPMASSRILHRHQESPKFDGSFNYRSVIGKLNFLEKASRPDLAYAAHQCARYSSDPRVEHAQAVKWIGRYLHGTADKGMIVTPDRSKGLEVHVDADFVGNWNPQDALNADTAKSRHGYLISYAGCPIVWKSQLQPHIALSSCEAEYIGLSTALREVIPIIDLIDEMAALHLIKVPTAPKVHCKVFEDNIGALEMAREHKFRPRTKHIHIKYHHFRQYVDENRISIHSISTHDQTADIFTKPLPDEPFHKHRLTIMGW